VKLFGRNQSTTTPEEDFPLPKPEVLQGRCLQLAELGKALLTLLQQYRWEIEELKSSRFIRDLEEWKNSLAATQSPEAIDQLRLKLYERANEHLKKERTYLDERERELKHMIALLSEAVTAVSSSRGEYHQEIMQTTNKLTDISHLEDIRKMRSLLTNEIQHLKETVRQKQSAEKLEFDQLSQHVEALQNKLQSAVSKSMLDQLTGLYNRQGWDQEIFNACQAASIMQTPFAVAMVDIDNFKTINDDYGHQVGDLVLTKLGKAFKDSFRADDFIARYGGDEISFLLAAPAIDKAHKRLERLVRDVGKPTYHCSVNNRDYYLKISISCGFSFYRKGDTPETLVRRADEALYHAKKNGKNQVAAETALEPV
jgi:diguanylate cyclase